MTTSRWFDERVEAYLDGELPDRERRLFEAQLELDEALREEVALAQDVSGALQALPRYRAPRDLGPVLTRMITPAPAPRRRAGFLGTALAASLAGVIAIGLSFAPPSTGPTDAELAEARHDLEVALAYLDKAGQQAGREVGASIIQHGLVVPMRAPRKEGAGAS